MVQVQPTTLTTGEVLFSPPKRECAVDIFIVSLEDNDQIISNLLSYFSMGATIAALFAGFSLATMAAVSQAEEADVLAHLNKENFYGGLLPTRNLMFFSGVTITISIFATLLYGTLYASLAALSGAMKSDGGGLITSWLKSMRVYINLAFISNFVAMQLLFPAFFNLGLIKVRTLSMAPYFQIWVSIGFSAHILVPAFTIHIFRIHKRIRNEILRSTSKY